MISLISSALLASGPLCALRRTLDIACPTCGFTRSLEHLAHGDFLQSFAAHPMGPGLFVEIACVAGIAVNAHRHGRSPALRPGRWLMLNAALFLGIWGIRAVTGTLPH